MEGISRRVGVGDREGHIEGELRPCSAGGPGALARALNRLQTNPSGRADRHCRPRTRAAQGRGKWDAVLTAKKVDPACALS